jgi:hypothetical protein
MQLRFVCDQDVVSRASQAQNFFLPNSCKHSNLSVFGQFTSMGRPIMMRSEGVKTSGGVCEGRTSFFLSKMPR